MDGLIIKIWELSRQRERLRRELKDSERKARAHGPDMRAYYKKKLEDTRVRLANIDAQIKELEDKRAEELAGVDEDELRKRELKARRRGERSLFGKKKEEIAAAAASGATAASGEAAQQPAGLEDRTPTEAEGAAPEMPSKPEEEE